MIDIHNLYIHIFNPMTMWYLFLAKFVFVFGDPVFAMLVFRNPVFDMVVFDDSVFVLFVLCHPVFVFGAPVFAMFVFCRVGRRQLTLLSLSSSELLLPRSSIHIVSYLIVSQCSANILCKKYMRPITDRSYQYTKLK